MRNYVNKKYDSKAKSKARLNMNEEAAFHLPQKYRPSIPTPHSLEEDMAAAIAQQEAEKEQKNKPQTIEDLRRKAGAHKEMEKLLQELHYENEDPLIRQAYEELEDEDRRRKGLPPLKRAPPGKIAKKSISSNNSSHDYF